MSYHNRDKFCHPCEKYVQSSWLRMSQGQKNSCLEDAVILQIYHIFLEDVTLAATNRRNMCDTYQTHQISLSLFRIYSSKLTRAVAVSHPNHWQEFWPQNRGTQEAWVKRNTAQKQKEKCFVSFFPLSMPEIHHWLITCSRNGRVEGSSSRNGRMKGWNWEVSLLKILEMPFMEFCIHCFFYWRLEVTYTEKSQYIVINKIINLKFTRHEGNRPCLDWELQK